MLNNLYIENIAVIEKTNINFTEGLNILTGETGAGKSIVIDSINAILGNRTSRDLIRNGADSAFVSAEFIDLSSSALDALVEFGFSPEEDGSVLVQRELTLSGKGKCRVNGRPTTVSVLRGLGEYLIDIHGQHASYELMSPELHITYIDKLGDLEDDIAGAREVGRQIVATSDRALRQVQDLTRIARLDDALFEMEPVNPRIVCDEVVAELWKLFRFNKRELQLDYRNKRHLAVANRQLLYSVVYNFCLNAMNYGGEELPSRVSVYDRQNKIRIDVRDFGPTVPTKVWREIKDGFVKKPVEIAMRPGSSGLGLFIASKFSRYMNAEVGAIRHRDGTSFYVDLMKSKQASLF